MALIAWLKREGFGSYDKLDDFLGELGRRSTSALGALGAALVAKPEELAELGQGNGQALCAELVGDLRVAKGARVAALKAVLMAGAGAQLAKLFVGAFDLSTDARLPDADRTYLVKSGLKAFCESVPPAAVNLDVLRGAAAATTAVQAVGVDVVREILSAFPASHTPVTTLRHAALGEPLSADLEARWLELLAKQHRAAKNAPPAAKRLGTAPVWPPVVPPAMEPMLEKAAALPLSASAPAKPVAPSSAPAAPPAPAGPKEMPALRPRARAPVNEDTFRSDDAVVSPEALRSVAKAIAVASNAAAPKAEAKAAPLAALRFGEQIELVATRGTRAIERLLASFDARAQTVGKDRALSELELAAQRRGSNDVNAPMLDELLGVALDKNVPSAWRLAARAVLKHLSPDRLATLPDVAEVTTSLAR